MDTPTRRIAARLLPVAALALAIGLSGCGVAPGETPTPDEPAAPAFTGISVDANDHSVALRDLYVPDPGGTGYQAGSTAPLTMQLWNNTTGDISLVSATLNDQPLVLVGGNEATSATFAVVVPGGANIPLNEAAGRYLRIGCLPVDAPVGSSLPLVFTFSNEKTISVNVPVGAFDVDGTPAATGAPSGSCSPAAEPSAAPSAS